MRAAYAIERARGKRAVAALRVNIGLLSPHAMQISARRVSKPMNKTKLISASCLISAAFFLVLASGQSQSQPQVGPPQVQQSVKHAVTPPLRDIARPWQPRAIREAEPLRRLPVQLASLQQQDAALQTIPSPTVGTTPLLNFAGVGNGDYGFAPDAAPPDPNLSVGATQVVQWVNESFAVFDKATGALILGPVLGNSVFAPLANGCATNNDGDPIVQYDKINNRWILTQFSVSTTPYLQCVAVSNTSDATGTYNVYSFNYGSSEFPDYAKVGVWPDAYYISFNMFTNTFTGAQVCAYDGAAMRAGGVATQVCFHLSSSFGGLLPSDLDGSIVPPAGSPNFFVNFGTNSLNLWRFHVDFANPSASTLTGPTNIPVAAFTPACSGGGACIPQPGTSQKLDSLADRLMYRLAYRNFADGHEALVVNHTVAIGGKGKNKNISGVRWYELRNASGCSIAACSPVVFQQGTFAPNDSAYRWMGSIAMDKLGDMALGYSVSSSSLFPSIRYTGRVPTDPLGTMETENTIQAGLGSQLRNLNRWGDYTSMSIDPVDDCTFFYTSEYQKANGTFNWSTRIGSFKFPTCQ